MDLSSVFDTSGVVAAGALGMFIFMEGFFSCLAGGENGFRPITETFRYKLKPPLACETGDAKGFCIDTLVEIDKNGDSSLKRLAPYGNSLIVQREPERLKIHLHTAKQEAFRKQLEEMGRVVQWSTTDLRRPPGSRSDSDKPPAIHIVTDAAGSITRQDAVRVGVTLLDSYIVVGDKALPETLIDPAEIYALMRRGVRVTTAQASVFERHQRYQSIISRYGTALYLCVGSVYTGNYREAAAWKASFWPTTDLPKAIASKIIETTCPCPSPSPRRRCCLFSRKVNQAFSARENCFSSNPISHRHYPRFGTFISPRAIATQWSVMLNFLLAMTAPRQPFRFPSRREPGTSFTTSCFGEILSRRQRIH